MKAQVISPNDSRFLALPSYSYRMHIGLHQRWGRGHTARGQGHKKIQGQGQPFRGQTLSRPRTGMLEAKGQGHKRKKLSKEKRSSKKRFQIFSSDLQNSTIQKQVLSSSREQSNF